MPDRQNQYAGSPAHGVGPKNRAEPLAENRAFLNLREKRQPDMLNAPRADHVGSAPEPVSEPGHDAVVDCAGQEEQDASRQERENDQGFRVAAPEQEQDIDQDETEEGAAREREHQRNHHQPHRREQRRSEARSLRLGPGEEQERIGERVQAAQFVRVHPERGEELARQAACQFRQRGSRRQHEHDH